MSTRTDYITGLDNLVGTDHGLATAQKNAAVALAVAEHNRHRPQEIVEDIAGNGGFDYALSGLTDWEAGFSRLVRVEYPVDDETDDINEVGDDSWITYKKPSGEVLRFVVDRPNATETIRVAYICRHVCDDVECTIAAGDEHAVQLLTAAHLCEMLAARKSDNIDSTIMADSVDHGNQARTYAARAKSFRQQYHDHMGIHRGQTPAASVTKDQDVGSSYGTDRLTHPWRRR